MQRLDTDTSGCVAFARDPETSRTVDFKVMIHKIHMGAELPSVQAGKPYVIYGFGNSVNDFSDVVFPGDRRDCQKCHVNGSEQLPLPSYVSTVNNPRALYNPIGAVAAACTGCHTDDDTYSHTLANTTVLGESCSVCHGKNAEFSVDKVHAR